MSMSDGSPTLAGDTGGAFQDRHELSTRAIVLITLGAISATITLLAIAWWAYSAFKRKQPSGPSRRSRSTSLRSSVVSDCESQLPTLEKTSSASEAFAYPNSFPSTPNTSIIASPDLQKLYPISPAMLSTQSPNAQILIRSAIPSPTIPQTPSTPSSIKSLDLRKLWPISPTLLSYQSPSGTQMSIRSAISEQDLEAAGAKPGSGVRQIFHR